MEPRLENIFCCNACGFWYLRDDEGPRGDCKHCFWGIPPNRKAILTVRDVIVVMAREMEERLLPESA